MNRESAVPIEGFVRDKPDMEGFRRQVATMRSNNRPERYPFPIDEDVANLRKRIDGIMDRIVWACGEFLFDTYEAMQGRDPMAR